MSQPSTGNEQRPWAFGVRLRSHVCEGFTEEFTAMTMGDTSVPPDGSPPPGYADRVMLRQELVKMMKRAHKGTVLEVEYERIDRGADTLAELKFPRPGNHHGWHYRLYAGTPFKHDDDLLAWAAAGRKPDTLFSAIWDLTQNDHIATAVSRFRTWLLSRIADLH